MLITGKAVLYSSDLDFLTPIYINHGLLSSDDKFLKSYVIILYFLLQTLFWSRRNMLCCNLELLQRNPLNKMKGSVECLEFCDVNALKLGGKCGEKSLKYVNKCIKNRVFNIR